MAFLVSKKTLSRGLRASLLMLVLVSSGAAQAAPEKQPTISAPTVITGFKYGPKLLKVIGDIGMAIVEDVLALDHLLFASELGDSTIYGQFRKAFLGEHGEDLAALEETILVGFAGLLIQLAEPSEDNPYWTYYPGAGVVFHNFHVEDLFQSYLSSLGITTPGDLLLEHVAVDGGAWDLILSGFGYEISAGTTFQDFLLEQLQIDLLLNSPGLKEWFEDQIPAAVALLELPAEMTLKFKQFYGFEPI